MAIKMKHSVKEAEVQTDIKIGSSNIKARVMSLLVKRGAPNPNLPKDKENEEETTFDMLRSMINVTV